MGLLSLVDSLLAALTALFWIALVVLFLTVVAGWAGAQPLAATAVAVAIACVAGLILRGRQLKRAAFYEAVRAAAAAHHEELQRRLDQSTVKTRYGEIWDADGWQTEMEFFVTVAVAKDLQPAAGSIDWRRVDEILRAEIRRAQGAGDAGALPAAARPVQPAPPSSLDGLGMTGSG